MQPRQFISKLTPRGWVAVGGAAAVAIVFLVLIFQMASAPSYTTLMAGLDPSTTGKMTTALDAKGISYQLQNNGTALAVEPGQTAQARIALAGAGLLTGQNNTLATASSSMPLGASSQQQQMIMQSALETQLAQTIEQIQGVSGASVQLVLPDSTQQVFGNSTPASAAVLISDSGALDPGSVRGIAQLVSSSVPNLALNKVTITDSTGQLLWPNSSSVGADGTGGSLLAKQQAEQSYDAQVENQVNAVLVQMLGPGKAVAQVNANLNTDSTTQDILAYAKKGIPVQQQTDKETLAGTGTGAGTAGAAGNIPGYAATGAGGRSNYNHTVTNTTFGVGKTVTHKVVSPGALTNQTINVSFDKSVPAASQQAVLNAVKGAVGFNAARGDSISSGTLAFAKPPAAASPASTTKMIGYAKYVLVGLGALIFLFFVTRAVRKREREGLAGEPTWLRELEQPRPLPALPGAQPNPAQMAPLEQPTAVIPLQAPVNVARRQVEDLVERDADRVAAQVRAWMSED